MTPEERQLLTELFNRVRSAQSNPRDRDAEAFIADAVRAQPYAPYLLAQTVIVQEHALRAANDRLQQLEAEVQDLQRTAEPQQGGGSFLGDLGKSLFGGGPAASAPPPSASPQRASVPPSGPWGAQAAYAPPVPPMPAQPQWSPVPPGPPTGGGGNFLHGALGAAAGVAGGVLLADSIRGLFGGHTSPLGIGSGFGSGLPGGLGQTGLGGGETVVNNYYENANEAEKPSDQSADTGQYDNGTVNDTDFTDTSGDWSTDDGTTDV